MRIHLLSLFPQYFQGPLDQTTVKKARDRGILQIECVDVRDFADPPHYKTDDRPLGKAIQSVYSEEAKVVYMSPQGIPLTAAICRQLAQETHIIVICGHYEGIDERVIELYVDEEISIGDYVLTDGCLPAMVLINGMARFIPGVIGHPRAVEEDSLEGGGLDCPHYTRPVVYKGLEVPPVLRSGDHQKISAWREEKAREKTMRVRPDL
mgnify:CR=1 FL=1